MFHSPKMVIVFLYVIVNNSRNTEAKTCQCNFNFLLPYRLAGVIFLSITSYTASHVTTPIPCHFQGRRPQLEEAGDLHLWLNFSC